MKKIVALFAFLSVLCSLSAQKVNETVALFGKEQLSGYTINVDNADAKTVAAALTENFENQYKMKGTTKNKYRIYENQPFSAFGDAHYDIYFTTTNIGKKKNQATQVTVVVSTGNMNCITFSNDPRTARNIVLYLETLPNIVEAYALNLRADQLNKELKNLKKERESMEKDLSKAKEKVSKTNEDIKKTTDQLEKKTAEIEKLQDQFNRNQDPAVKDQISKAVKEKESLQKTQTNTQKKLLKMNDDIVKLNKKLEANQKEIDERETELKKIGK